MTIASRLDPGLPADQRATQRRILDLTTCFNDALRDLTVLYFAICADRSIRPNGGIGNLRAWINE